MIAIIGTGLTGLTLATRLAQLGFAVTLIGADVAFEDDYRTTAILQPNIDFLDTMGLWKSLAASATPLITMELHDRHNSIVFDASEMNLDQFGFNLVNSAFKKSLADQIKHLKKRITWRMSDAKDIVQDKQGWCITLADGKKITARLLIGADGRNSLVRTSAGILCDEKPEQQAALVTVLECTKPHHYTSVEYYRDGGPFTLVPCTGKKLALVWCDQETIIDEKLHSSSDTLSTEITAITKNRFGALRMISKPQKWPVRPLKAQRLTVPHLALVGEAAHVLPPIGAQGFNTSLYDIQVLCAQLVKGRALGLAINDATILDAYARARQTDVALRFHGINRLNDIIRHSFAPLKLGRRVALTALQRLPFIRRPLMHFALSPLDPPLHMKKDRAWRS